MNTLIQNGLLVLPEGIRPGWILLREGQILDMGTDSPVPPSNGLGLDPEETEIVDAKGLYVAPGFIDLHTHGAGGADFMDGTVEAYLTAARMHARHGTTLLFPTTLTSTNELLFASFDTYAEALPLSGRDGAAFGGMHLEGPYFSPSMAGAQDPRYLRDPKPEEYLDIISRTPHIARWSFAPERPGAPAFAAELRAHGIVPSIAHTNATFADCDAAFKAGCSLMTHFYSCMSTITRRNAFRIAGTVEYGYYQDGMDIEIIGDGIHVCADLLKLVVKIKGPEHIVLVTDSMRAAGMPEGPSILGGLSDGQKVIVEDGVAKLPDRSAFAGSVATADRLVRTMVREGGVSLETAVGMATANPARIMGLEGRKGALRKGFDADVVIFDKDIRISRTIVKGKTVYSC